VPAAPSPRPSPGAPEAAAPAEEEYARLRERLVRAVARTCPPWLAARAEDVVQAALLKMLLRRPEGLEPLPSSYLYRVAHSCLVDEIRRLRRRREVALDEAEAAPAPAAGGPERSGMDAEFRQALEGCLQVLVEPRRLAVTLHLQGHPVAETARIMGWTEKKAENLVYRALADLRRCLSAKGLRP
jgi:RNA polymerase sigma-70 factor (ECF subfamily)